MLAEQTINTLTGLRESLYVLNTFLIHPCCTGSSYNCESSISLCNVIKCYVRNSPFMIIHVTDSPHCYVYDHLVTQTAPAISGGTGVKLRYTGTILVSFVLALTGFSITAKGNVCIYPRLWPDVTVKMNSSPNAGVSFISISKFHILFTHTEVVGDLRCESAL